MATLGFGLRAKSILALVLACLFAVTTAGLIGWRILEGVRNHFGEAYARNLTQLKRERILAPISRDLALAKRLANSEITRQWLASENDAALRALFFKEAEAYRYDLSSRSYFLCSNRSRGFYFHDDNKVSSDQPRYMLDPEKSSDQWFFNTLRQPEIFNINVNYDAHLDITQVWLNIQIRARDRVLGIAGTGIDLSTFLKEFIDTDEPGITPMIVAQSGAIQAHRNKALIAINQAASAAATDQTLPGLLRDGPERVELGNAMIRAINNPDEVVTLHVRLDGREQLLALAYVPELKW